MEIVNFLISMKNPSNYPIKCLAHLKKNNHPNFQKERYINSYILTFTSVISHSSDLYEYK